MKFAKTTLNKAKWLLHCLGLAVLILCLGCTTTVIPHNGRPTQPSFDGNDQTSGIITNFPDHSALITGHAAARYQLLVIDYGAKFQPPIQHSDGLNIYYTTPTGSAWHIDAEHLTDFGIMQYWKRKGVK